MPKNAENFICEMCNFTCFKNSNYNKHLMTAKHKNRTIRTEKMPKTTIVYSCDCGKTYNSRSSLWYHKNNCQKKINHDISNNIFISTNSKTANKDQLILDLLAQNKELITILNDTIPKIGNNNTTTTNNNNTFNLNIFLNEDCRDAINFSDFINNIQVSFEDLEHQSQVGFVKGISKLFIENLQELGTYKRPIHCTDKKRKTLYIKENNEWDKEGSYNKLKKGINKLSIKGQTKLIQEKEDNQEEYKDIDSKFSEKCIAIQRNLYPDVPSDTAIDKVIENISNNSGILEKS